MRHAKQHGPWLRWHYSSTVTMARREAETKAKAEIMRRPLAEAEVTKERANAGRLGRHAR
jgi:hypothetical protein